MWWVVCNKVKKNCTVQHLSGVFKQGSGDAQKASRRGCLKTSEIKNATKHYYSVISNSSYLFLVLISSFVRLRISPEMFMGCLFCKFDFLYSFLYLTYGHCILCNFDYCDRFVLCCWRRYIKENSSLQVYIKTLLKWKTMETLKCYSYYLCNIVYMFPYTVHKTIWMGIYLQNGVHIWGSLASSRISLHAKLKSRHDCLILPYDFVCSLTCLQNDLNVVYKKLSCVIPDPIPTLSWVIRCFQQTGNTKMWFYHV